MCGSRSPEVLPEPERTAVARVTDGSRCYLPVQERDVVESILLAFPTEFDEHFEAPSCPRPRELPFPRIVDMNDSGVVYDDGFHRKQPDWTYLPA